MEKKGNVAVHMLKSCDFCLMKLNDVNLDKEVYETR